MGKQINLSEVTSKTEAELRDIVKAKRNQALGFGTASTVKINKSATVVEPEPIAEVKTADSEPAPEPAPAATGVTLDQVKELLAPVMAKHSEEKQALEAQNGTLATENEQLRAQNEALTQQQQQQAAELERSQADTKTLEGLSQLMGKSIETPNVNILSVPGAAPRGLAADYVNALQSAKTHCEETRTGYYEQRNGKELTRLIRQCKSDGSYGDLLKDIEAYCKSEFGLFSKSAGPTTGASVPDGFLDILSPLMRETHNQINIWWQFATTVFDETAVPGKSALVPRFGYLPAPTTLSDYELSTYNTFTGVAAATGASGDSEALDETSVPIIIKEFGRGKNSNTKPIYIPEFHRAISLGAMIDAIVESRLMQNYFAFEDLLIRTRYAATTQVLYNKKNSVGSAPADISAAGDLGTMTRNYLNAVYGYLFAAKVPATEDNRFFLVLNATAITQLKSDLDTLYAPVSTEQAQAVTSALSVATGVNIGHASGYFGDYCGFHIFASNAFGVGAAGQEGVSTITLGGALGTATARDSYAFGVGAVGRGIGMPMEIRPSGVNAYGRGESYIWVSHENTQTMDVDSAIGTPANQQTRVYKIQTLDTAR